ncbi:MAG: nucleotidyltransferase domain-containing protein [Candidatus Omnitrophota bacterium]|nr:nucleotidyltransferase domain-containing protein [Candidatus Omnitrophota bacterium]
MINKNKTGLSKHIENKIVKIVLSYKKPDKILLFGSRATGYFTEKSDIDIALFGKKWDEGDLNEIKFRLDECLSTPLKIDIVNFYSSGNKRLKSRILNEGRLLYES